MVRWIVPSFIGGLLVRAMMDDNDFSFVKFVEDNEATGDCNEVEHLEIFSAGSCNELGQFDVFSADSMVGSSIASPSNADGSDSGAIQVTTECSADKTDDLTDFSFNVAFNAAMSETMPSVAKPVWETGVWKQIFSDDNSLDAFGHWGPEISRPLPSKWEVEDTDLDASDQVRTKRLRVATGGFAEVVSFRPDIPWKEQRDADLQRGVNLWMALTSSWDDSCSFCLRLDEMENSSQAFTMFAHVFSGRAPVTIRKRGAAIMKICDYYSSQFLPKFPADELQFYKFLCNEIETGAPKSRLKGFYQAVVFCRHVLDMEELQPIISSKRCQGATADTEVVERKQASPLTVKELLLLHDIVENSEDDWNALFAGAALLCCYCRSRWGDMMRVEETFLDHDEHGVPAFLETRCGSHKTMRAQMHRHQFLPMCAPVIGVNGSDWTARWLNLRSIMGIELPPHGLIMPAPDRHGLPSQRPLDTSECSKWLRMLLHVNPSSTDLPDVLTRKVSSHSLKCTFLSFAAKRGLPVPDRLLLGYHSSPMQMALTYSRDGAAHSLLLLERLIGEIVSGAFRPDSTRSGRFVQISDSRESGHAKEVKDEIVISSDESIDGSALKDDGSDSSSTSDSSGAEIPIDHRLNKTHGPPKPPEGFERWQHSKLKTMHLTQKGYTRVFVCGRSIGNFHVKLDGIPRFDSPTCWSCFKKAQDAD